MWFFDHTVKYDEILTFFKKTLDIFRAFVYTNRAINFCRFGVMNGVLEEMWRWIGNSEG